MAGLRQRNRQHVVTVEPLCAETIDDRLFCLQQLYSQILQQHSPGGASAGEFRLSGKYLFGAKFTAHVHGCHLETSTALIAALQAAHVKDFPKGTTTVNIDNGNPAQVSIDICYEKSGFGRLHGRGYRLLAEFVWLAMWMTATWYLVTQLSKAYDKHGWVVRDKIWF